MSPITSQNFGPRFIPALPHAAPMHWLDWAQLSLDRRTTRAGRLISSDHPFLENGVLLPTALIELMAQAAAAGAFANAQHSGKKLTRGVLAAIKEFCVLANVQQNDEVILTAVEQRNIANFISARLQAHVRETLIAHAQMTFHLQFE